MRAAIHGVTKSRTRLSDWSDLIFICSFHFPAWTVTVCGPEFSSCSVHTFPEWFCTSHFTPFGLSFFLMNDEDNLTTYNVMCEKSIDVFIWRACVLSRFSHVQLFATLWSVTRQVPLSMGFSRQEYWSGLLFPPPGNLPHPGIKPVSLHWQVDSLSPVPPGKPIYLAVGYNCKVLCWHVLGTLFQVKNNLSIHWAQFFEQLLCVNYCARKVRCCCCC